MNQVAWALVVCTVLSLALTPAVRAFCLRVGIVDRPGPRSMHTAPIATLGGLGMLAAFAFGIWHFAAPSLDGDAAGLIAGAVATLAVGALDDLAKAGLLRLGRLGDAEGRGLRPLAKVIGQLAAASLAVALGVQIDFIHNPLATSAANSYIYLHAWAGPATIAWIFCVSTIINLIDGLDGLAAGVVAIVAATLLITSLEMGLPLTAALLSVIVLGSAIGFLPWNWAPARIIMGDSGALFLGYALATVSVEGALKSPAALALAVPVVALGLPVFDAAFAIFRRWRRRGPIGVGDRDHLHHRLLALGLSTRDTVLMIYIVTGWLGIGAIALGRLGWLPGALLIAFVVSSLLYLGRRAGVLSHTTAAMEGTASSRAFAGSIEVAATKSGDGRKR